VTLADVKAEPLAVWDVREQAWYRIMGEAICWAMAHIDDAVSTYRVEFFLVDAPFAVVWRYKRNEQGRCFTDPATGEIACAEPVVQMLDELPPARLLGR
jgi:hypothetical protein